MTNKLEKQKHDLKRKRETLTNNRWIESNNKTTTD